MTTSFALSAQEVLKSYSDWAETHWLLPKSVHTSDILGSHAVMALGLVGEAAEVAEVVAQWAATDVMPEVNLTKELGDVAYYYARISKDWKVVTDTIHYNPTWVASNEAPISEALALCVATGKVSEQFKKYVRDDHFDHDKFSLAMNGVFRAWMELCAKSGLSWRLVLEGNQEKINSRAARGVLRGNGDHR